MTHIITIKKVSTRILVLTSGKFLEALGSRIGTYSVFAIHFHFQIMCGTILTCGILASYLVQTTTEVRGESDVPKNPQKYFTNKSVELLRQN